VTLLLTPLSLYGLVSFNWNINRNDKINE